MDDQDGWVTLGAELRERPMGFADASAALAWYDREHANLRAEVAARAGLPSGRADRLLQ